MRKLLLPALVAGLIARTANAADLGLSIEVPRLDVAEYHRPYVAIWIENPDQSVAADLAVWYDVAKKNNEGTEWLQDMRQWWRRSGRNQQFPVDGVSGATKPAGKHALAFNGAAAAGPAQARPVRRGGGSGPRGRRSRAAAHPLPMAAAEGRTAERARRA